jgi:hypothetical protein
MKHIRTLLLPALSLALLLPACTPQEMQAILGGGGTAGLTNEEVVNGLKEALRVGAERSVEKAGAAEGFWSDGRIRIPFPQDAIAVRNTLLDLGFSKPVEDFERTLNQAAELATREAVPVFTEAITGMSIGDGFRILRGGENAATDYLREKTSATLMARFTPVVDQATAQVDLTRHWNSLATAYNTASLFTGTKAVEPDLNTYVAQRAMDGLFLLLAQEEKKIREDPLARTTALLQRVFAAQ